MKIRSTKHLPDAFGDIWNGVLSRGQSIRAKFSMLAVACIGVMAISLSSLIFSTANASFSREALGGLGSQNQAIAHEINNLASKAASDLLLARQNPVFDQYFLASNDEIRQSALMGIHQQMLYIQKIYEVDEICLIESSGSENARGVQGEMAAPADLSEDESENPFFRPTMALEDGEVYETPSPYLSPDSNRWVISFSTPIVLPDGTKAGLLHFEIPLVWFADKIQANSMPGSFSVLVAMDGTILAHPQIDELRAQAGLHS